MSEQQTVCRSCGTEVGGAKFCPECGTGQHDVAAEQTLLMNGLRPDEMAASGAADSAPNGHPRPIPDTFRIRVFLGVALVLAVAGIGLGLAGFLQAQSSHSQGGRLSSQLAAVRQQLKTADGTIANLRANSQTGTVTALKSQTSSLKTQLGNLATCVPELQQQINGLNVQTQWQKVFNNTYLTNAFLQNPTVISSNCNKVLNGSGSTNGP